MTPEDITMAARLLVAARREASLIHDLPEALRPVTLADAYAVHHAVIDGFGSTGGWKTAPSSDGVPYNWARIPQHFIHADMARLAHADFQAPGVELEIGLRLGHDLPPRDTPYGVDEVADAIGSAHAILEILSARFFDKRQVGAHTLLADGLANGAVIVGSGNAAWREGDFASAKLALDIGDARWTTTGTAGTAPVLAAATMLANGAMPVGGLKAGQIVITGARLGPTAVPAGSTVGGEITGLGKVAASFT